MNIFCFAFLIFLCKLSFVGGVPVDNFVKDADPDLCLRSIDEVRNKTHKIFYPRSGWKAIDICHNFETIPLYGIFSKLLDRGDGFLDIGVGSRESEPL